MSYEMRRKDRKITDFSTIIGVIDECEIIRLGFSDGDYPYIVPLNFAYEVVGEQIYFYVHGAMAGRKYELMKKNGKCSFEMDIPITMECLTAQKDVTMRYKSVMGCAEVELLDGDERMRAIDKVIMGRHEETRSFEYNKDKVAITCVAKLTVKELSCKINPVKGNPD